MNWPPSLAFVASGVGLLLILSRLPGLINPTNFRRKVLAFPRSVIWGRVLMAFVTIVAGWNLYHAATDNWAWARPVVLIGVPICYWLVIQYADSFLALRSAAACLLFLAKVMVTAADRHDHPLRLVVTITAYIWVVMAIWAAIAPHHFRDIIKWLMDNDNRCRCHCAVVAVIGAIFIVLGAFVYA